MKPLNAVRIFFYATTILLVAGCGNSQLSRGKAAEILKGSELPFEATFLINSYETAPDGKGNGRNGQIILDMNNFFLEKKLMKQMYPPRFDGYWTYYRITFTEEGWKYATPGGVEHQNTIAKLCQYAFNEITGITSIAQTNIATVQYSVKRTNWTPFGLQYKEKFPAQYPEIVPGLNATFQKYDDGWRLLSLGTENLRTMDNISRW